ncbi:MAG: DUF4405 domain-containing protein, partial [Calditrichales bacterium]
MAANQLSGIWKRFRRSVTNNNEQSAKTSSKKSAPFRNLILHLHPPAVNAGTLRFNLTFGLGGMAALLFIIQVATGIMLRFVYEPFPGIAYDSIRLLQDQILFGQLIRNIHHWSGIFIILITFLHLLRVYFTSAFHHPRQFNWVLGLGLLVLVISLNFTGYLLPWDQLAYWAITVSTGMLAYIPLIGAGLREIILGGNEVGAATLLIFYNLHTSILPLLFLSLMAFHFWRVRKAGGVVVVPVNDTNNGSRFVSTYPNLVARELVVALVLIAVILMLSVLINAPLQTKANPDFSPNPAKAPWYFQGFQEMLRHLDPLFAVMIIPLFGLLTLIVLPYLKYDNAPVGVWFISPKGRQAGFAAAVIAFILSMAVILTDEYVVLFRGLFSHLPGYFTRGILPVGLLITVVLTITAILKKKYRLTNNETRQTVFIILVIGFILFSLTSIVFRGAGMHLSWP